jgi:hypothetical protein
MRSTAARWFIPDRPGSSDSPSAAARLAAQRARPAAVDLKAPADANVAIERERRRGRGAQSNASGRYEPLARTAFDDGWQSFEELPPFKTTVTIDSSRKIITRNTSPDISFDRSINPYRGCEHGLISRRSCSPSRMRRSSWNGSSRQQTTSRARSLSAPIPIRTSR